MSKKDKIGVSWERRIRTFYEPPIQRKWTKINNLEWEWREFSLNKIIINLTNHEIDAEYPRRINFFLNRQWGYRKSKVIYKITC